MIDAEVESEATAPGSEVGVCVVSRADGEFLAVVLVGLFKLLDRTVPDRRSCSAGSDYCASS